MRVVSPSPRPGRHVTCQAQTVPAEPTVRAFGVAKMGRAIRRCRRTRRHEARASRCPAATDDRRQVGRGRAATNSNTTPKHCPACRGNPMRWGAGCQRAAVRRRRQTETACPEPAGGANWRGTKPVRKGPPASAGQPSQRGKRIPILLPSVGEIRRRERGRSVRPTNATQSCHDTRSTGICRAVVSLGPWCALGLTSMTDSHADWVISCPAR